MSGSGRALLACAVVAVVLVAVGMRAIALTEASSPLVTAASIAAFLLGVWVPLLAVLYAVRRQRVAMLALAFCVGVSVNVVFLANAVPANAAAGNSSDFFLTQSSGFGCGGVIRNMIQTNAGSGALSFPGGAGVSYEFCSDTFTSGQSLAAGTTVASPAMSNGSATKDCDVSGELLHWHASSSTTTSLGAPGTATIPANGGYAAYPWSWTTSAVSFEDGDRLRFIFTFTGSGANCNNTVLWSTTLAQPSKITVAIVVPEGIAGLLLLAPGLRFAARWWKRRRP